MFNRDNMPAAGFRTVGFSTSPLCLLHVDALDGGDVVAVKLTTPTQTIEPNRALPNSEEGAEVISLLLSEFAPKATFDFRGEELSSQLPSHMKEFVYFISDEDGYIKIGKASNVEARFNQLQTASRQELTVLAVKRGGHVLEGELHKRFSHLRVRGEWFKGDEELLNYVEGLKATSEQLPEAV